MLDPESCADSHNTRLAPLTMSLPNFNDGRIPQQRRWSTKKSSSIATCKKELIYAVVCVAAFILIAFQVLGKGERGGDWHADVTEASETNASAPRLTGEVTEQGSTAREGHQAMWGGWESINRMFVFGDSYSDTGFDPSSSQPSPDWPMGNHNRGPGTFVQETRWINYLTTKYNDSEILTYNFAHAGALIDRSYFGTQKSHDSDLFGQLNYDFLPSYIDYDMGASNWKPESSLFVIFIGINDNFRLHDPEWLHGEDGKDEEEENAENRKRRDKADREYIQADMIRGYRNVMSQLYDSGARNFLLMNAPPMHRYPDPPSKSIKTTISNYNTALARIASSFRTESPNATVIEFNTHAFLSDLIDSPSSYPPAEGIQDTKHHCEDYHGEWDAAEHAMRMDFKSEKCEFALEEYLFWDTLHLTVGGQEALGEEVAKVLRVGEVVGEEEEEIRELRRRKERRWEQMGIGREAELPRHGG